MEASAGKQSGPIAVYGATGYTGKLVARELDRLGCDFILSGRNEEKLKRVAASLEHDIPTRRADIDDPQSLIDLLDGAACVINCAGPFSLIGEPVVRAAVETGTHYVDTTGEQSFMKQIVDGFDSAARDAGVAVICGMGYDYAPGDCAARIAADGLEPVDTLSVAYSARGFGMSRGTMRSVLEVLKGDDLIYRDGCWRRPPRSPETTTIDFPEPVGEKLCMRFPSGEVVSVPRHTTVRDLNTWMTVSSMSPVKMPGKIVPYSMPLLSGMLKTPVKRLLDKMIERAPEGPSETDRKAARVMIICEAKQGDRRRRVTVRGEDVYGFTAATVVQAARLLVEQSYSASGALSAASAFDPKQFLDLLKSTGLTYEVTD